MRLNLYWFQRFVTHGAILGRWDVKGNCVNMIHVDKLSGFSSLHVRETSKHKNNQGQLNFFVRHYSIFCVKSYLSLGIRKSGFMNALSSSSRCDNKYANQAQEWNVVLMGRNSCPADYVLIDCFLIPQFHLSGAIFL